MHHLHTHKRTGLQATSPHTGVHVPMNTQICFVELRKPKAPESGDIFSRTSCIQHALNGTQQNSSENELAYRATEVSRRS